LAEEEAAGRGELRGVAGEEPGAVEDPLALGGEDLLGGEVLAGQGALPERRARSHRDGEYHPASRAGTSCPRGGWLSLVPRTVAWKGVGRADPKATARREQSEPLPPRGATRW